MSIVETNVAIVISTTKKITTVMTKQTREGKKKQGSRK